MQTKYKTVDEYIKIFPPDIRETLEQMRQSIQKAAPEATEVISYQMPAFKQNGVLVWFAAFKDHIGFFPTAAGIEAFKKELSPYITGKGTVQFPLDGQIPYELVGKIVIFRVKENLAKKKGYEK